MKVRVDVMLKTGVLDPQGAAVRRALGNMGFGGVEKVRQGKVIELELATDDPDEARAAATEMAEKLLANTVIERYEISL